MARPYSDYLSVNREFVPVYTVQADREHPDYWLTFHPNSDFSDILGDLVASLEGDTSEKRKSLWMSGAYGTGKSFAAFTLKHILEDDTKLVKNYFNTHNLSLSLLNRLESIKKANNIVVIYRSSSSGIIGDNRLFIAVQDSIKKALKYKGYKYFGAQALYDDILNRIKDTDGPFNFKGIFTNNKNRFTEYSSPDEIVKDIEDSEPDDCLELLETIVEVSELAGFTFGNNAETINNWIKDVIKKNKIKIVFIWDEFTEYFLKNQYSTSGLQELSHASFEIPFYFLLITHKRLEQFMPDQDSRKKLEARFKMRKLEMGSTTAFMLMRNAIQVVPDLKNEWTDTSSILWNNIEKVVNDTLIRYDDNIKKEDLKLLLPLHPYAAFLLQVLAREVNSNQRTMFQFLCGNPDESDKRKSNFRWFIETHSITDWCYLSSDYIWDYFFFDENVDLDDKSRNAINSYNTFENHCTNESQKRILKVALLLTAMKQEKGKGVSNLLRPTLSNLVVAFTGTPISDDIRNVMDKFVKKSIFGTISEGNDILYVSQSDNYDEEKLKEKEQYVRKIYDFEKLISNQDFQLLSNFTFTGYGASRFEIMSATHRDLKSKLSSIKTMDKYKLPLVFLFAKNEGDMSKNQDAIKEALHEYDRDIIFANASNPPLSDIEYESFVKYQAKCEYFRASRQDQADINLKLAKTIIDEWKRRISDSAQITLHTQSCSSLSIIGISQLSSRVNELDSKIFPFSLENMISIDVIFKVAFSDPAPLIGMGKQQIPSNYAYLNNLVNKLVDDGVWSNSSYYESIPNHPLSKMKIEIEKLIENNFALNSSVNIADIWDRLKEKPFGLLPCTGSAFLVGFLLKEYADNGFYIKDAINNPTSLTASELANKIVGVIKSSKHADTYSIVRMTEKQSRFCKYSGTIFSLSSEEQNSIQGVMIGIKLSLEKIGFPLWALNYYIKNIDNHGIGEITSKIIDGYCQFISSKKEDEKNETRIAEDIADLFSKDAGIQTYLKDIYKDINLKTGLTFYITEYKPELISLSKKLKAGNNYIIQIKEKFSDFYSWLWNKNDINNQIDEVFLEYQLTDAINKILYQPVRSIDEAANPIRTKMSAIKMPYEFFKDNVSSFQDLFLDLINVYKLGSLKETNKKAMLDELMQHTQDFISFELKQQQIFGDCVKKLIDTSITDSDIKHLYSKSMSNSISRPLEEFTQYLKIEYSQYKKTQKYNLLLETWKKVTGSSTPASWSEEKKIPILCLFTDNIPIMRDIFELINTNNALIANDIKIENAIKTLKSTSVTKKLGDFEFCEQSFNVFVLGEYSLILPNTTKIRDMLFEKLGKDVYGWFYQKTRIDTIIKAYAEEKYSKEFVKKVLTRIDTLDAQKAKAYLKELIKNEPLVGIKIMKEGQG
jgi:hypothetical protein